MMDIENLLKELKRAERYCLNDYSRMAGQAATALSTLQGENEEMQKQLNMFSEFLCYMTGGLLSKTNYTAQEMVTAAERQNSRNDFRADRLHIVGRPSFRSIINTIEDYCKSKGLDFETLLRLKHKYNKTRSYRHGGKRC